MTSHQPGSVRWRRTTILIRSDIFDAANSQGIDISSESNRALAERLGIDYSQQKIPERPENPVIIAKEGAAGDRGAHGMAAGKQLNPVLNAEDPSAPARLLKMKKERALKEKSLPVPAPAPRPDSTRQPAAAGPEKSLPAPSTSHHPRAKMPERKGSQKKGKDDLIRRFITQQILRTEPAGEKQDRIPKDDLYQLFVRWCRGNTGKGGTVPDKRTFTLALKNRFAMEESATDGVRYWENVTLR